MAYPMMICLLVLAALIVVPRAQANDILSTYPSFTKCDKNIINIIKTARSLFPQKSVYETMSAQKTWMMVLSSYDFKMSDFKCVTAEVEDNWFNVTVTYANTNETSYKLTYVIREVEGGLVGQTIPEEPRRSWKLTPILAGDVIQALYVCNEEYESEGTPVHGDIFMSKTALKDMFSSMKNVEFLSKIMEPFTKFTFAAAEKCFLQ